MVAVLKVLNNYPSDSLIMTHLYHIFLVNSTPLGISIDLFIGDCEKVFYKAN